MLVATLSLKAYCPALAIASLLEQDGNSKSAREKIALARNVLTEVFFTCIANHPLQDVFLSAIDAEEIGMASFAPLEFELKHQKSVEELFSKIEPALETLNTNISSEESKLKANEEELAKIQKTLDEYGDQSNVWARSVEAALKVDREQFSKLKKDLQAGRELVPVKRASVDRQTSELNAMRFTLCPNGADFEHCTHEDKKKHYMEELQRKKASLDASKQELSRLNSELHQIEKSQENLKLLYAQQIAKVETKTAEITKYISVQKAKITSKQLECSKLRSNIKAAKELEQVLRKSLQEKPVLIRNMIREQWLRTQ